ncbi:class I SAM-dependent methyltransferase [bacterium]|nr:MAG: class I SAM-dependent methyltransferase [bacterium]
MVKVTNKLKRLHELTINSMRTYKDKDLYVFACKFLIDFYEYSRKKFMEWSSKDLLKYRKCPICHSDKTFLVLDKSEIDGCKYYKCSCCDFVYMNPLPSEDCYSEIYVTGYGGLDKWWYEKQIKYGYIDESLPESYPVLERLRGRQKAGVFLDYGCGTGRLLAKAEQIYDIYGVDIDDYRIQRARNRLKDFKGERILYLHELDESVFLEKFDIIYSNQTLEHLLEPVAYLQKFYKWLKPGGIVYLSFPASDSFAFSFLKNDNSMSSLGHVSLFSSKSITYALRAAGFEKVEIFHNCIDVTATEFWKKLFNKNFLHRHCFINHKIIVLALYPIMLITTAVMKVLNLMGILKGNYMDVFARKGRNIDSEDKFDESEDAFRKN